MQDFVARLRHEMGRQNIRRGDPLGPLLELLGEMLLHFTHLTENQTTEVDALIGRLGSGANLYAQQVRTLLIEVAETARHETQDVRRILAEGVQAVRHEMLVQVRRTEAAVHEIGHERHLVHAGVEQDAARLLTRAVQQHVRWRNRTELCLVMVTFLVVTAGAWMLGRNQGYDRGVAALNVAEDRFAAAVTLDSDRRASDRWLDLIRWNRIFLVPTDCHLQRVGNGLPVRRACSFLLWDEPPDDAPPAVLPDSEQPQASTPDPSTRLPVQAPIPKRWGLGPVEFH